MIAPVTTRLSEPRPPLRAAEPDTVILRNVSKVYGHGPGQVLALDRVSLEVAHREFVCLVGASGCGKTTLLNLVAGLDDGSAGAVERAGRAAVMFQESSLFPWLTVHKNVELALRFRGVPRGLRRGQAEELLALVRLDGFGDRQPHELSGGMRQRVALGAGARATRRGLADGRTLRRPRRHDP